MNIIIHLISMKSISTVIYFKHRDGNIPLVYLIDEQKFPPLATLFMFYIKEHKQYSFQKITKMAKSISLLYDFFKLYKNNNIETSLISEFAIERVRGKILDWKPVSKSTANQDYYNLKEFSLWCYNNFNVLNFQEEYNLKNYLKESYKESIRRNTSLFQHLDKNKTNVSFFKSGINNTPKTFPIDKIIPLINSATNPRDKILLILMAFGGRRISELSHLFLNDFIPRQGKIDVIIAHPQYSYMEWKDKQIIRGTREQYLKEVFNLSPRNTLDKSPLFSGWKGMRFDDERLKMSEVYFISNVKEILYNLHKQYMVKERNKFHHHPYYFINKKGNPLTLKGLTEIFYRYCNKIGLTEHNSFKGINPHGLRHFYGYYCYEFLELDLLLIQRYMGHVNNLSTQIYAKMSKKTISNIIKNKVDNSDKLNLEDLDV